MDVSPVTAHFTSRSHFTSRCSVCAAVVHGRPAEAAGLENDRMANHLTLIPGPAFAGAARHLQVGHLQCVELLQQWHIADDNYAYGALKASFPAGCPFDLLHGTTTPALQPIRDPRIAAASIFTSLGTAVAAAYGRWWYWQQQRRLYPASLQPWGRAAAGCAVSSPPAGSAAARSSASRGGSYRRRRQPEQGWGRSGSNRGAGI